jgi:hypothetical protein
MLLRQEIKGPLAGAEDHEEDDVRSNVYPDFRDYACYWGIDET